MNGRARPLIYVAAPLFSCAERTFNASLKDRLSVDFDVFLPQEDGGLVADFVTRGASPRDAALAVFDIDLSAVRRCNALIIVMDGRAIDEGACVELGIAYSLGKICVGLQTDARRLLFGRNNPMIDCALNAVFTSEEALMPWMRTHIVIGQRNERTDAINSSSPGETQRS